MRNVNAVVRRLTAAGILIGLLCSGMILFIDAPEKAGAAFAYQATDYPAPTEGYPAPGLPTATFTRPAPGQATATQEDLPGYPIETFPAPPATITPAGTVVRDPNLFLTEDAQMGDSRITPGLQTLDPTRTPTASRTPTPTISITPPPEPTPPPTAPPSFAWLLGGKTLWPIVAAGFFLPLILLSLGVLVVTVAREAQKTS